MKKEMIVSNKTWLVIPILLLIEACIKKDVTTKDYYSSGNLKSEINYKNNMLDGKSTYYFDSIIPVSSKVEYYAQGKKNGPYYEFNKDNSLKYYCQFINDQKIGDCISFKNNMAIENVRSFFILNGESYLSQCIEFDSSSAIDNYASDFVLINYHKDTLKVTRGERNTFDDRMKVIIYKFKASSNKYFNYRLSKSVFSDSVYTNLNTVQVNLPSKTTNEIILVKVELIDLGEMSEDGWFDYKARVLYYSIGAENKVWFLSE